MQESGIVLSRLFSTVTYCIAFQFSSESKRAISWVDKEDKLSPVASDYFKNFSSKNSSSTPSSLSIRRVYESRCDERE